MDSANVTHRAIVLNHVAVILNVLVVNHALKENVELNVQELAHVPEDNYAKEEFVYRDVEQMLIVQPTRAVLQINVKIHA